MLLLVSFFNLNRPVTKGMPCVVDFSDRPHDHLSLIGFFPSSHTGEHMWYFTNSKIALVLLKVSYFNKNLNEGSITEGYVLLLFHWVFCSHFSQTFERRSSVKSNRENSRERWKNKIHDRKCNEDTNSSCWLVSIDFLPSRQHNPFTDLSCLLGTTVVQVTINFGRTSVRQIF